MSIKVTYCNKIAALRHGASEHWQIGFECSMSLSLVIGELTRFTNECMTPGQQIFISQNSINTWDSNSCSFHARVYETRDAMLIKLTYA